MAEKSVPMGGSCYSVIAGCLNGGLLLPFGLMNSSLVIQGCAVLSFFASWWSNIALNKKTIYLPSLAFWWHFLLPFFFFSVFLLLHVDLHCELAARR